MIKQFKTVKALALIAACIGSGHLSAVINPPAQVNPPAAAVVAALAGNGSGALAPIGFQSVGSSYAIQPTMMAVDFQTALGLIGAVTAEAAEGMGSGVGGSNTPDAVKAAGSAGSVEHSINRIIDRNVAKAAGLSESTRAENAATSSGDFGMSSRTAGSSGSNHRASAWMRASFAAIDNSTTDQQWNAKAGTFMVGTDYKINKMFCFGLGLLYRHVQGRTEFNNGTFKQDTYGVNPYLLVVPHKNFNLEFVGGWNMTNGKDTRVWNTFVPTGAGAAGAALYGTLNDGQQINGQYNASPKSQSMFGGVFANFVTKANKTSFSLQVGYAMMQSKTKTYTETSLNGSQPFYAGNAMNQPGATFKAQTVTGKIIAGYQMTPSILPFLTLHGLYDVKNNQGVAFVNGASYTVGRSAFGGGGGFQVRNDDALSGSLQFDYTKRGQLSTYVTALRLHYGF